MTLPVAYVTRTESFSAAHRLNSTQLSEAQNQAVYGKCNHAGGHGHNYKVQVTVKGPVDQVTGMVMNISDIKMHLQSVLSTLDHKNIDEDVQYFKDKVSTAENIAIFIWEQLQAKIGKLLHKIKIHETDKNVAVYKGEQSNAQLT